MDSSWFMFVCWQVVSYINLQLTSTNLTKKLIKKIMKFFKNIHYTPTGNTCLEFFFSEFYHAIWIAFAILFLTWTELNTIRQWKDTFI